jgi:GNAT superfamily N-acetyltransferase
MQSMWSLYSAEMGLNYRFIERPEGFISYEVTPTEYVYIVDFYVLPEFRRKGLGLNLLAEVESLARSAGKTYLASSISVAAATVTESMKAHLAVGFVPFAADGGKIWFQRKIEVK